MCSQVLCIGYFVCYHVDKIPLFFNVNYCIFAVFVFSNQISRGRCQLMLTQIKRALPVSKAGFTDC